MPINVSYGNVVAAGRASYASGVGENNKYLQALQLKIRDADRQDKQLNLAVEEASQRDRMQSRDLGFRDVADQRGITASDRNRREQLANANLQQQAAQQFQGQQNVYNTEAQNQRFLIEQDQANRRLAFGEGQTSARQQVSEGNINQRLQFTEGGQASRLAFSTQANIEAQRLAEQNQNQRLQFTEGNQAERLRYGTESQSAQQQFAEQQAGARQQFGEANVNERLRFGTQAQVEAQGLAEQNQNQRLQFTEGNQNARTSAGLNASRANVISQIQAGAAQQQQSIRAAQQSQMFGAQVDARARQQQGLIQAQLGQMQAGQQAQARQQQAQLNVQQAYAQSPLQAQQMAAQQNQQLLGQGYTYGPQDQAVVSQLQSNMQKIQQSNLSDPIKQQSLAAQQQQLMQIRPNQKPPKMQLQDDWDAGHIPVDGGWMVPDGAGSFEMKTNPYSSTQLRIGSSEKIATERNNAAIQASQFKAQTDQMKLNNESAKLWQQNQFSQDDLMRGAMDRVKASGGLDPITSQPRTPMGMQKALRETQDAFDATQQFMQQQPAFQAQKILKQFGNSPREQAMNIQQPWVTREAKEQYHDALLIMKQSER